MLRSPTITRSYCARLCTSMPISFSQAGMLSPDGRCHSFDAAANGYTRGEGAGLVLLKPLSRAEADGDRVYALIRGSATNQDGHTTGLTVPSERSQEAVTLEACRRAGISPAEIDYVEAHGTGTPVGDPIEARALGRALAAGRPSDDLLPLELIRRASSAYLREALPMVKSKTIY